MVFAIILMVLLAFSLFGNFSSFMSGLIFSKGGKHTRTVGPRLEEVITEDNDASDKIAVIDVQGIITSHAFDSGGYGMVELIKAQLKHAEDDSKVKAVILKVDSPGGEVLASDEIYRRSSPRWAIWQPRAATTSRPRANGSSPTRSRSLAALGSSCTVGTIGD